MDSFVPLKLLTQFATPPGMLVAGLAIGWLIYVVLSRRFGRLAMILAIGQSILFSLHPVVDRFLWPLEQRARAAAAQAPACCYDAIVILGGASATERVAHAARLFHRGVAPRVLATGGTHTGPDNPGAEAEAQAMRCALIERGVPADRILIDERSLNTIQNIEETRRLIGPARIALVTSAFHMPRSLRLARLAGFDAQAFPSDWSGPPGSRPLWEQWTPSASATYVASQAIKEYLALIFDRRGESLRP
ncbi:MAG: YdcF family protein [Alphaproteobacteria bacterium]|nr:YdcF family protein [Alphaproteobacteria bacterium]